MHLVQYKDWGEVSTVYDDIKYTSEGRNLSETSEAQTRFDVIDRIIKEVLQWKHGTIDVEEYDENSTDKKGYVDYILRSGDYQIIIEAKKYGASFPEFTKKKRLKLGGSVLSSGPINDALIQAERYAKSKDADIVCVTNGRCWCLYQLTDIIPRDTIYAYLFYPLDSPQDAEILFKYLALPNVENDSLSLISYEDPTPNYHILLNSIKDGEARLGRNNIADFISPAIEEAFQGDSIIGDKDKLNYCFVNTDTRTKYDNTLSIYINDRKSNLLAPAKRIRKSKSEDELHDTVKYLDTGRNVPVTLLLGSVGAGKSTYLSHFELNHAQNMLKDKNVFWVYIDFEKMGKLGNPRKFIYDNLKDLTLKEHSYIPTDYNSLIKPAYEEEIKLLARGPFGLAAKNKEKFEEKIQEIIEKDYNEIEPYVDKLYSYISKVYTCIIVLDNIDLYEDSELEIQVFSEGVALSKKLHASVMVSIRDTTYIKHKNESIFNAYELRKFWIDPPPFREVLSKRLNYGGAVLKGQRAKIPFGSVSLSIKDLSIFFEIAHTTLLNETSAKFIESIADGNIRKGISLVSNFLSSAHVQADRAINNFLNKDNRIARELPFHEVFKGCVLGPWKYYREDRAEIVNILNSGFNSKSLQFLRAYILKVLHQRAMDKNTLVTPIIKISEIFRNIGATDNQVLACLQFLHDNKLVRLVDSPEMTIESSISITISGAYYINHLIFRFEYLEAILYDTLIFSDEEWEYIFTVTEEINNEHNIVERVKKRADRIMKFYEYIQAVEIETVGRYGLEEYSINKSMDVNLATQIDKIVKGAQRNYGNVNI